MRTCKSPRRVPATRRAKAKAATRRAVLAAAMDLFAVQGFAGTSVAEIAAKARVVPGTVMFHFGRKEDLLAEIASGALGTLVDATAKAAEGAGSGLDALQLSVNAFFEHVAEHPKESAVLLRSLPSLKGDLLADPDRENLHVLAREYTRLLEKAVQRGLADESISAQRGLGAAQAVLGLLLGSAGLVLFSGGDLEALRAGARQLVSASYAKDPSLFGAARPVVAADSGTVLLEQGKTA